MNVLMKERKKERKKGGKKERVSDKILENQVQFQSSKTD